MTFQEYEDLSGYENLDHLGTSANTAGAQFKGSWYILPQTPGSDNTGYISPPHFFENSGGYSKYLCFLWLNIANIPNTENPMFNTLNNVEEIRWINRIWIFRISNKNIRGIIQRKLTCSPLMIPKIIRCLVSATGNASMT